MIYSLCFTKPCAKRLALIFTLFISACSHAPTSTPTPLPAVNKKAFERKVNEKFKQLDQNRNGRLELASELTEPEIQKADTNRDQSITIIEWVEYWDEQFQKADKNNNQRLENSESIPRF